MIEYLCDTLVFHLIGNTAATITDAQVQAQLAVMNNAFANTLGSTYGVSDDAQISSRLAQITKP